MPKQKYAYTARAFLNEDPEMTANIVATVDVVDEKYGLEYGFAPTLKISDCNSTVSLDFGIYNDEDGNPEIESTFRKLDLLADVINNFVKHVKEQVILAQQIIPQKEEATCEPSPQ